MKNEKINRPNFIPENTKDWSLETRVSHIGRRTKDDFGFINPSVYHASTVCYQSSEHMRTRDGAYTYGLKATPTMDALTQSLSELEGAAGTCLQPSGLSALVSPLMAVLSQGDHLLMSDSVYQPTRKLCDDMLTKFGVEVEYYDPLIGKNISRLFKHNTKVVFLESPGSQTFEMQDLKSIIKACKEKNIITMMDNTWASPVFYAPLLNGVDISINAGTKYLNGHSDVLIGYVSANEALWPLIEHMNYIQGLHASPDDVYLTLRGMRTMPLRMKQHMESGIYVARWLESREEVTQMLHPALESHPQHHFWKENFCGANGLFSFILNEYSQDAVDHFIDHLEFFGIGFSWGGFESLIVPFDPRPYRTATKWEHKGQAIRIHIGLEDPDDLIRDLEKGLNRLA